MQIGVITLFPELVGQVIEHGVAGRAARRGLLELSLWNPRDFTTDRHRAVDDRAYGGGPGMVMQVPPLAAAIDAARGRLGERCPVVHLSPQGEPFTQRLADELARHPAMILLCGRYEGVDERLVEARASLEISIGDYVLSGGELPAMVVIDACTRLLPGALGDDASAQHESFVQGLLDHPQYTRPEHVVLDGSERTVPAVLLSGDHEAIRRWRLREALGRTWLRRPELLQGLDLSAEQEMLLKEFIRAEGKR